ncbi:hypothetical protein VMCG_04048 [Cytospora schulzeri]|uniref:Uncharacterized protein n=1 Tax=Cytospora schulzeri TaxID=448051 RepID=A0A423WTW6_9PEZI|nr:hypothetical protein VMCG_04048 [Valsa malicola]
MSAHQGPTHVSSSLERYIRSLPNINQEDLNRTDYPPTVHECFQPDEGGSDLGTQPLCAGHGGEVCTSGYPDPDDVEAGRIRFRDCIELAESWLSTGADGTTIQRLRGHWRIQSWSGQATNSLAIIHYKTFARHRASQAQRAIMPQAMQARDVAVEASVGGRRLRDMDGTQVPRSIEDWYQHTFATWTEALWNSCADPVMYDGPVAPSSSDMAVHGVDHVLDGLNASVMDDYHGPEDDAGSSKPNETEDQRR